MNRSLRLLATLTMCVATRVAAQAPTSDQQQPAQSGDWSSTSGAKAAAPLPAASPMNEDLAPKAAPAKAAEVPLPPPPKGTSLQAAPAPSTYSAPAAADGAAAPDGSKEPKVKFAADQTGAMVQVTQDLDSDKIRQDWAGAGGTIPAYEASLGMSIMSKTTVTAGTSSTMTGVGLNGGFRVAVLSLAPPNYETRDTSWNAWRFGGGMDLGGLTVNMVSGPSTMTASMMTMSLTMTLGFMHAFGSFDSPSEWSGNAVGAEWAPSWQQTSLTIPAQTVGSGSFKVTMPASTTTTSSFNATGFDLFFQSGSMQSMAAKMGKKARMKITLFVLPPVGQLPFLMTANVGATWY